MPSNEEPRTKMVPLSKIVKYIASTTLVCPRKYFVQALRPPLSSNILPTSVDVSDGGITIPGPAVTVELDESMGRRSSRVCCAEAGAAKVNAMAKMAATAAVFLNFAFTFLSFFN